MKEQIRAYAVRYYSFDQYDSPLDEQTAVILAYTAEDAATQLTIEFKGQARELRILRVQPAGIGNPARCPHEEGAER